MKKISCIIIEDEHLLAEVLADYVKQVSFLELRSVFGDAVTALEYLKQNPVDLIFIDINLPKLKGIDFIKMFRGSSQFIITTAYHEYAIEGYELNVIDYLLKPIEFNRFLMAVNKVIDSENKTESSGSSGRKADKDYFYINVNKKRVKVDFADVLYIEGMKEYVKIHLSKEKFLITKIQIGQVEDLLNSNFVRIHRSFIIARNKVTAYNHAEVSIGNIVLPVGTNYKESLSKQLE